MGRKILLVAAVAFATLVAPVIAVAQQQPFYDFSACEGDISSLALGAIPASDAYAVDIFDPTDAALQFRKIFLAELNAAAKITREDGNLVFSFRAESIFRGVTSDERISPSYRGEEGVPQTSPRSAEDETRDLIRSDRRARGQTGTASQQILVEAELRNKQTQRVLWLATVRCRPVTADANLLMNFVSKAIVENLGQAVRQKPL